MKWPEQILYFKDAIHFHVCSMVGTSFDDYCEIICWICVAAYLLSPKVFTFLSVTITAP